MTEALYAHHEERLVGELWIDDQGAFCFRYTDAWTADDRAFPISLSLPMSRRDHVGGAAHTFFSNLLPEGGVRTAVCRRLGISESNDFALLRAIGGECAGALTIDPEAKFGSRKAPEYERLTTKRLQRLVSDEDLVPLLLGGPSTRLSLAGAQDKLPVAVLDDVLHLPLGASPSTHILKLPNPRYAHLPVNEAFVMGLARKLGMEVVDTALYTEIDPPGLLVARYDRSLLDGAVVRLHQEDYCQALGLPPSRKYEQEDGPSFAAVADLTRSQLTRPLTDINRLLEWQSFNVIAGNSDGHGKNLSILYEGRQAVLAPFYDLVATRAYDRLERKLAMSVGDRRDPDQLHRAHWELFAAKAGVASRVVLAIVEQLAEQIRDVMPAWIAEFRETCGKQPILQTLPGAIEKRARATRRRVRAAR